MKKIFVLLFVLFAFVQITFSQNYIGKTLFQVVIQEQFLISADSTEIWEKNKTHIDISNFKEEKKLIVHDLENYKVITCIFDEKEICISFKIVYYNLSREYVQKILIKKYDYQKGTNSWICQKDKHHLELCLEEKPGSIFVLEACKFLAENKKSSQ